MSGIRQTVNHSTGRRIAGLKLSEVIEAAPRFLEREMMARRIGLIVPSSNTTMETEIPAMLRASSPDSGAYTFHSSRMRMTHVTPEALAAMDAESDRCATELADARCDVIAYACLVAIMAQGDGYHEVSEKRLCKRATLEDGAIPVVSSAGALVEALQQMGVRKTALVTPYMKPLTARVAAYIEHEGITVADTVSLEVPDNLAVGRLDPANLLEAWKRLDLTGCDALVLSACVQMPSLAALQAVEDACGLPAVTAASATVFRILQTLGRPTVVPNAGRLLTGVY
jgi:maleate isomerase